MRSSVADADEIALTTPEPGWFHDMATHDVAVDGIFVMRLRSPD